MDMCDDVKYFDFPVIRGGCVMILQWQMQDFLKGVLLFLEATPTFD